MKLKKVSISVLAGALPEVTGSVYQNIRNFWAGISLLIEAEDSDRTHKILVDTGTSHNIIARRLKKSGFDPKSIDLIFITRWNLPHAFALPGLLRATSDKVRVIAPGSPVVSKKKIGIGWLFPDDKDFEEIDRPVEVLPGVFSTGPGLSTDSEIYEQAMVIDGDNVGLVIITGCTHAGINQIVEKAVELTGNRKINLIIGGIHYPSSSFNEESIAEDLDKLKQWKIKRIAPCYGTCDKVIEQIAVIFPNEFRWLEQGAKIICEEGELETV